VNVAGTKKIMPRTALETSNSVIVVTTDTGRMTEEPGLDSR